MKNIWCSLFSIWKYTYRFSRVNHTKCNLLMASDSNPGLCRFSWSRNLATNNNNNNNNSKKKKKKNSQNKTEFSWWFSGKEYAYRYRWHVFSPWPRKILHAVKQISLCALESVLCNKKSHHNQKPPQFFLALYTILWLSATQQPHVWFLFIESFPSTETFIVYCQPDY